MSKVNRIAKASALVAEFNPARPSVNFGLRTVNRASLHYKTRPGNVRVDGQARLQVRKYGDSQARAALMLAQVREMLCIHGVGMLQFVPYFNFARHVSREKELADSADSRYAMVREAVDRWAAQGLQREVLVAICANVFNITVEPGSGALPGPAV